MMKLTDVARPENLSDKQFLVHLQKAGRLTRIQLRAAAKALPEMGLKKVLKAVEEGTLELPNMNEPDPELRKNLPKLADAPAGLGGKQSLLWLRDKGSLSPAQVRAAARLVDEGKAVDVALLEAGAEGVLDRVPASLIPETPEGLVALTVRELNEVIPLIEDPAFVLTSFQLEVNGKDRSTVAALLGGRYLALGGDESNLDVILAAREAEAGDPPEE
jgi:hypothetical protein